MLAVDSSACNSYVDICVKVTILHILKTTDASTIALRQSLFDSPRFSRNGVIHE